MVWRYLQKCAILELFHQRQLLGLLTNLQNTVKTRNYHYLVPEFHKETQFKANPTHYVTQIREAKALGHQVKPTIVGPLTFLWLGKEKGAAFNRFDLLAKLVPVYVEILNALAAEGVEYIQIDEPALTLDLPTEWIAAYQAVYATFAEQVKAIKCRAFFFP